MTAKVYNINRVRGMVGVQTENGDFSVFELLSAENIEVGDIVQWEMDTSLGHTTLQNITRQFLCNVYFQNHHVHLAHLKSQLLY